MKTNFTVTFHDQKGRRQEGWIDKGDKVTIQSTDALGMIKNSKEVSVQEFLTSPQFDSLGSPEDRLKMLRAGGAKGIEGASQYERMFRNTQNFFGSVLNSPDSPQVELAQGEKVYRTGDWGEEVIKKAQPDYEHRQRQESADVTVRNGTAFTEPLKNLMIAGLKQEDLRTELTKRVAGPSDKAEFILNEARKFLQQNPGWSWSDLATFNRAMGNNEAANYLDKIAKGEDIVTHPILQYQDATIALPTAYSKPALAPYLARQVDQEVKQVKEASEKVENFIKAFMI